MLSTIHPAEVPVYARLPIELASGEGSTVVAADGRRYLDLYGGHAVAVTGHCHPRVVAAIRSQAERLLFYSNVVPISVARPSCSACSPSWRRARSATPSWSTREPRPTTSRSSWPAGSPAGGGWWRSRADSTAALWRRWPRPGCRATASSPRRAAGRSWSRPTPIAPWDSPADLVPLVDETVAAVIIEPVQGLAGARDAQAETLEAARAACDATGALLIFDEVQCGCGRTGAFTAAQSYGVLPDLLTLAKGIAAGLPMGAVLMSDPDRRNGSARATSAPPLAAGRSPARRRSPTSRCCATSDSPIERAGSNGGFGRRCPVCPRWRGSPAAG